MSPNSWPLNTKIESRPLQLHSSALSNEEFAIYTASLLRLCDGVDLMSKPLEWENVEVSYGEVRGALRERFGESVKADVIDKVL